MQNFEFYSPKSVEEALEYLAQRGEGCKVIAGGTDLIPALRNEAIHPGFILNILDIEQLRGIKEETDHILIGPTATFTEITRSEILNRNLPLLVKAAFWVGGPTIRNRGTIGGNICNASPAADVLPSVIALDGELELQSRSAGSRTISVAEVVESPYQTRIRPDEILTEIRIKKLAPRTHTAFEKVARRNAMARSYMSLSIVLSLGTDGVMTDIRVVLGAVEAVARRVKEAEDVLLDEAAAALVGAVVGVWIPEYKIPVLTSVFKRNVKALL